MEAGGKVRGGTREGIVVYTRIFFFFLQVDKGQSEDGSPLTPFDLLIQEVILDKKIITQHGAMASPHLQ